MAATASAEPPEEAAMEEREGHIDTQTEIRHLLRTVKTSLRTPVAAHFAAYPLAR